VNECHLLPCQNNGNCTNKIGTYICECPSGFTGESGHFDFIEVADLFGVAVVGVPEVQYWNCWIIVLKVSSFVTHE
jgi:hypothetical protein